MHRMRSFAKILSDARVRVSLICLTAIVAVLSAVAWKMGVDFEAFHSCWMQVNTYLVRHPWMFFLALVFLPGLPVPITALSFTAGVVWRQQPLMACLLCLLALILNLTWTYWLAAGPGRRIVEKFLKSTAIELPEIPQVTPLKIILILKLTPGLPLFFQNYSLGLLRVPFRWFLLVSVLCNGILGTGAVLSGVGLAGQNLMPAISGISMIVLAGVITQLIRSWLAKRKRAIADCDVL